jgi:outer membrane immunogenic protein
MKSFKTLLRVNISSVLFIAGYFLSASAFSETNTASWTGGYVGLTGGHTWIKSTSNTIPGERFRRTPGEYDIQTMENTGYLNHGTNGFVGGAEVGYNYQINSLVLGLEGDFIYTDVNQSAGKIGPSELNDPGDTFSVNGTIKSDWLSTVRGRVGYTTGKILGYVTGGLAIADYKLSVHTVEDDGPVFHERASSSRTLTGWVVGGGAEYAFLSNLSVKAEYLYASFDNMGGSTGLQIGTQQPIWSLSHTSTGLSEHIAKMGVNYRF